MTLCNVDYKAALFDLPQHATLSFVQTLSYVSARLWSNPQTEAWHRQMDRYWRFKARWTSSMMEIRVVSDIKDDYCQKTQIELIDLFEGVLYSSYSAFYLDPYTIEAIVREHQTRVSKRQGFWGSIRFWFKRHFKEKVMYV